MPNRSYVDAGANDEVAPIPAIPATMTELQDSTPKRAFHRVERPQARSG